MAIVSAALASTASAGGGDLRTISHHTSSGTGNVSEATEVVIAKPVRVLFKIRVKPNVRVEGKYMHYCRSSEGDRDGTTERFTTRSTVFEMPVFFPKTKDCQFYAEVARDKPQSNVPVKLAIRVLAAQRPGAPFRPSA
jgi:hypothetical protein